MAAATNSIVVRSFKYRLLCTKKQHDSLADILESQRQLYNGALEHRIGAWRKGRTALNYINQSKELTELRREPEFSSIPLNLQRWTLARVEEAFAGFFGRIKRGEIAGYPRFRGFQRWRSFGFNEFDGIRFDGKRIRFKGAPGGLRDHIHRPVPEGRVLGCVFRREVKGWTVSLQVSLRTERRKRTGSKVGIDVGITHLVALSNGETVPNVKVERRAERNMRIFQRQLSRCKRGSKRRQKVKLRLTRLHQRIKNTRSTYLHQVSVKLVRENDVIAIESLNVKGLAQGILARDVYDAAWSELIKQLKYKGENTGVSVIEVKAAGTSQTCPKCGQVAKKKLSQRIHRCDCGCTLDRDVAAAQVILQRARSGARVPKRKAA